MPYYITLHKGSSVDDAEPVLALSDPHAVEAVLRAVRRLLASAEPAPAPVHLLEHIGAECRNTPSAAQSGGTIGAPR
jgi:hypothetical protein